MPPSVFLQPSATFTISRAASTTVQSRSSNYLTLPKAAPKASDTTKTRAITGARVLISVECLAIIKEQEQKKKMQAETKKKSGTIRKQKKGLARQKKRKGREKERRLRRS